jgi:hypothetical protein
MQKIWKMIVSGAFMDGKLGSMIFEYVRAIFKEIFHPKKDEVSANFRL